MFQQILSRRHVPVSDPVTSGETAKDSAAKGRLNSWGQLSRRILAAFVTSVAVLGASQADAGWTVYSKNITQTNPCWRRAGLTDAVFTSYASCQRSVSSRVAGNKNNGQDFESFVIVETRSSPPAGCWTGAGVYLDHEFIHDASQKPAKTCLYYAHVGYQGKEYYLG